MTKKAKKKAKKRKKAPRKGEARKNKVIDPFEGMNYTPPKSMQKALSIAESEVFAKALDSRVKMKPEYVKMLEFSCSQGKCLTEFSQQIGIHYDTLREWLSCDPNLKRAALEGTKIHVNSLPKKLEAHLAKGHSFESFSGVANLSVSSLYKLVKVNPVFRSAKERGYGKSFMQWEQLELASASGRLVRVDTEKPRLNSKGEPIINPNTGEIVTDKTYKPTHGSDRTLVFAMQSRFKERRLDKVESTSSLEDELSQILVAHEEDEKKNRGET